MKRAQQADVLLDARSTRQMSVGMKAYARELTLRLPLVAPDLRFADFDRGGNFNFSEQVLLPVAIVRSGARIAHFLSQYVPLVMPRPFAITIHDLIHLRFPEYFKAKVRPYYDTVVRSAAKRAARVITDDERTVEDLARYLGVDPGRCRVVALGVDDRYLREGEPESAPRPYFFYAGNHRPHKNLPTLFEAWTQLPEDAEADLYVTGSDDFDGTLTRYRRARGSIVLLGNVTGERLARLYRGALAYVHPALREGFGLPLLEAMASGTPVIGSDDSAPAILRAHLRTFPARDVPALRREMAAVLQPSQERDARNREARRFAQTLTWDRCARATADVYREMLEDLSFR